MGDPADNAPLIGDIVREGTVESVDLAKSTCSFRIGDLTSGDVPGLSSRSTATSAGTAHRWRAGPPHLPRGRYRTRGRLTRPIPYTHRPRLRTFDLTEYADGARIRHDPGAHALTAVLRGGATARIGADGGSHPRLGDLLHPLVEVGLTRTAPTLMAARSLRPEARCIPVRY